MASQKRVPYPFKLIHCDAEKQKKMAQDFQGYPNGLTAANHWGFKLAGTVTEQEVEDAYNYPLDPRDVWVVTPPKCGTTWSQEMIWLLANNLDYEGAKTPLMPVRWNFLDFPLLADKEYMQKAMAAMKGPVFAGEQPAPGGDSPGLAGMAGDPHRPSPKFVKSHLPMSMNNPRLLDTCKVVYVARNPKDACVSYYNHNRLIRVHEYMGDLELFMEYFMSGDIIEAPFIEHMIEAWNLRHHPNMCFLFFEDMKRDLKTQIHKVAKFLGKSYSDEQIAKLASHLHIDNFRKNPFVNGEFGKKSGMMHEGRGNFIRKGQAGDWKNHFTPEMNAKFDKWMAEKLKGSDIPFVMELEKQE